MARAKGKAAPKPDKAARASWKNRIVAFDNVDPASLKANPRNWRLHPDSQKRAMADVFSQVGFVEAIIVNKRTGHILDGHMRHQLALEHREPSVPVLYVDMSVEEEALSLTILNPMAELATTDPEMLAALLADVPRLGGALDELLGDLEELAGGASVKETAQSGAGGSKRSPIQRAAHALRLMLAVTDVAVVERAIARTGVMNRGEALMTICREYLSEHGNENAERQLDAGAESGLEGELAQAAEELAGGDGDARRGRASVGAGLR